VKVDTDQAHDLAESIHLVHPSEDLQNLRIPFDVFQ
jgi:hypothetical protein